ncbi:hypothetical protein B296_00031556 [Ensete ventricosum]|uniref:Uncharacterized protein n=1 Tax=Ensete ventricosum TaxID=4639 RepID=A0A426Y4N0_ENSVE|nr:hypothetical protein B296_00031556 [Ensete ventricosum]
MLLSTLLLLLTQMRASSLYSPMILEGLQPCPPPRPPVCRRLVHHGRGVARACIRGASREEDGVDDHGDLHGGNLDKKMPMPGKHLSKVKVTMEAEEPSPERIEWNQRYCHKLFESNYCEVLGLLEFDQPVERSTMAVGFTVMVTLCLPVPVLVVMLHFVDAVHQILRQDRE